MTDGVLAAIIAAGATMFASFLQLRSSFAREVAARSSSSSSRRKSRLPFLMMMVMLSGAAVGGFALSQWLADHERAVQNAQLESLQANIATLSRTENQLAQARAEIESALLRKQGMDGVAVMITVGPCKPPLTINTPALADGAGASPTQLPSQPASSAPSGSTCNEAEASPVTLCAAVPANAKVTDVEVFARAAGADVPWSGARLTAGSEFEQARFSEKPVELVDGSATKQVCETFTQWSTERSRVARVLVRYEL
jgi:hypothetical protein